MYDTTLTRPFGVFVDLPVVKAYPRGFAQELIAVRRASRDLYMPSGGRTSSTNFCAISGSQIGDLIAASERVSHAPMGGGILW
jgi:hypothetical protein